MKAKYVFIIQIFKTSQFRDKNYQQAFLSILKQTVDKTLSKQGQLPAAPVDDGRGSPGSSGGRKDTTGGGNGLPFFKMPNIPNWVILVIVCVVIPTLICCCCIYCCCCRSKNGGTRRQGPSDEDPERQGGSGGGIGNQLRGMLTGAGGGKFNIAITLNNKTNLGAIMSMIQNCFRNRGGGGQNPAAGGEADINRGGYVPPRPQAEEGKGLYPAKSVEDEGAGGGW